jgi:type 1 glutamine amidotransferase
VSGGKGFVCIHIATCVSAAWPEYHDITGGGWISGASFHPPYGEFTVNVSDVGHPGAKGVADFSTNDELYMGLALKDGNNVFITGEAEDGTYPWGPDRNPQLMPGGTYPLGWTRQYGDGNVFVLLLGHDGRSFETPEFQRIVLNGVEWAAAKAAV